MLRIVWVLLRIFTLPGYSFASTLFAPFPAQSAVFPLQIELQHPLQVFIKIRFFVPRSETRLLYSTQAS